MATQNVKVVVTVTDNNSTKAVIKDVNQLNATIKAAKASAAGVNMSSAGGTSGSRAAAQKSQPTGSDAVRDYGTSRGSAGLTGASSRDFANQAQGLGGLVRLYATYAANVFAVGAAFRALSGAADTSNMIKGLDQLGTASGVNLGSLAKRLVAATDGAISLREAMEATTKASSSGMNSNQIVEMGKVAKQASQALGIDMVDAVSRLSRGIAKLEPELLDELGILVRVDTVVKDYAKSVGKSASAITDFEKQMAFANATLAQGKKKFGEINIDTNPYTKLTASVKDLTQSGLELVNTFVTPIIKLLASSPTSLGLVIAGLGTMLVKQAIPAFGEYRKHLDSLARESSRKVGAIFLEQEDILANGDLRAAQRAEAAYRGSAKAMSSVKALQTSAAQFTDTVTKKYSEIAAIDPYKISNKEISTLELRAKQIQGINAKEAAALRMHVAEIRKLRGEAEAAANSGQAAYEKKTSGNFSTQGQNRIIFDRAAQQASATEIRSLVSQRQALYGAADAWTTLNTEIAKSKAGMRTIEVMDNLGNAVEKAVPRTNALQNGMARVSGAFGIVTGAISKAVSAFQPWILVALLAVEGFTLLNSALSGNKKEQESFSGAITRSASATDLFIKTITRLNGLPFGEQFNTAGMLARANAIGEVSAAVQDLVDGVIALNSSANNWDKFIDGFKTVWGGDARAKFAKSMTDTVVGALGQIEGSAEANKVRQQLSQILDIDPKFTAKSFNKAIAAAAENAPKLKELNAVMKELGISQGIAASKSKELEDSFKVGKDAYKAVLETFKIKDPIAVLGASMLASSGKLTKALEDPTRAISELAKLSKDADALQLLDPADASLLNKYGKELNTINNSYEEQASKIAAAETALNSYNEKLAEFKAKGGYRADATDKQVSRSSEGKELVDGRNKAESELAKKQENLAKTNQSIAAIVAKFPNVAVNQFSRGAALMGDSISAAINKASYGFKEAVAGSFTGIMGAAEVQKKVAIDKINSDNAIINSQAALIRATQENTAQMALTTARAELMAAKEMDERRVDRPQAINAAQKKVDSAEFSLSIVQDDPSKVLANIKKVSKAVTEANTVSAEEGTALVRYLTTLGGIAAQKISNANAKAVAEFTAEIAKVEERLSEAKKPITQKITTDKAELSALDIQKSINTNLNTEELARKRILSISVANNEEALKVLEINSKLDALAIKETNARKTGLLTSKDKLGVSLADGIASERLTLAQEKKNAAADKELSIRKVLVDIASEVYQKEVETLNLANEIASKRLEARRLVEDTTLAIAQSNLETAKTTELYTAGYIAKLEAEQNSIKASVDSNRAAEDEKVRYALEVRLQLAEYMKAVESKASEETLQAIRDRIDANAVFHSAALSGILQRGEAELASLETIKQHNMLLTAQEELMTNMVSITNSLSTAFGAMGEALGKSGESIVKFAQTDEKYLAKKKLLSKEIAKAEEGSNKQLELKKQEAKLDAKNQTDQLDGISEIAGETKKMFKEKSAAHRAFAAVERVTAAMSLALKVQAAAVDLALLPGKIAAGISTMFAQGGFAGFAGAAAFLAIMGGLGFSGGGGSVSSPGMDSGSVQETQGTGRQYQNGELTDTQWGVLGDLDAKAEDISNSLSLVKDYTSLTSVYGRSTKKALEAIEVNTRALAAQVVKGTSISGDTSGFGTLEKSSPGFLGLFASSTSIIDKGIEVTGKFNDILKGIGSFREYETVQKTNSGFLGIGKSTKISQNFKDLPQEAAESIQGLFQSMYTVIIDSSKMLMGKAAVDIDKIVEDMLVNFKVSGEGLSGEELATAIQAEASVTMNKIVGTAYPWLEEFRKLGEGFTTTLVRMATTMDVVNEKFRLQGVDFAKYLPKLAEASQASIDQVNAAIADAKKARDAVENTKGVGTDSVSAMTGTGENQMITQVEVQVRKPSDTEVKALLDADAKVAEARLAMARELGADVVAIAEEVNNAQKAYTQARLAILDNATATEDLATVEALMNDELGKSSDAYANASDEVKNLYNANVALADSTAKLGDAQFNQIASNLRIYNALVEQMGGLDAFVEKTDYFFDNFFSKEEQLAAKRTEVSTALWDLAKDDSLNVTNDQVRALMSASGDDAIKMFRDLAQAQDLSTESGRATYAALLTLAPAFHDSASAAQEAANAIAEAAAKMRDSANALSATVAGALAKLNQKTNDYTATTDTSTETTSTYTQGMISAGKSIIDLITNIRTEAAKMAGVDQAQEILGSNYRKDYSLAMSGDLEASKRIPTSSKAYLDSQTKGAATTSDARVAMLTMANQLAALPATKTYEQSVLETTSSIDKNVAAVKDALTALQLEGIKLDIQALSKIEKLIQFTVDTKRLSPELKEILLSDTLPALQRNVDLIQSANATDTLKNIAKLSNLQLVKEVELVLTSKATDTIKKLGIGSMEQVVSNIDIIINSTLTETQKKILFSVNETVAKTINLIVSTDKLTDDQKRLGLMATDEISKSISLITKSDLSEEDRHLALMNTEERTKTVKLIIEGNFTEDQKVLALQSTTETAKYINVLINDISLSDEQRSLALQQAYEIDKTINLILNDKTMSAEERTLALQGTSMATRKINAIMQDDSLSAEERTLALDGVSAHIRNIDAIMKDDSLSAAEKELAYAKELDAIKRIKVVTEVDSDSLKSVEDILKDTLEVFSSTLVAVADPTALRAAKDQIEAATSDVLATITPESSPEEVAAARALLEKQMEGIIAPILAELDPKTADKVRAQLSGGLDDVFARVQVDIDEASAVKTKDKLRSTAEGILASVGVEIDGPQAEKARGTIESALSNIQAAIQTEVDTGSTAETRKAIQDAIGSVVAAVGVEADGTTSEAARVAITNAVQGIRASITTTSDGTAVGVRDSISETVSGILADVGVDTGGSEIEAANAIRDAVSNITSTITIKTDGSEVNIAAAISAAVSDNTATIKVVESGLDTFNDLVAEATTPADKILQIVGAGGEAYAQYISSLTQPVTQTITINTVNVVSTVYEPSGPPPQTQQVTPSALGNIFVPGSVTAFKLGGLPSDTILNKPTMFDMGVAGEAGPEAIMPLKRGKDGSLGVRAMLGTSPGGGSGSTDSITTELRAVRDTLVETHNAEMQNDARKDLAEVVDELRALRKEVEGLRVEARATTAHTNKTAKLLDRAMPTGNAIATKPV